MNRAIKFTLLILLPKVDSPAGYSNFRPISLSSFASKIVTKILEIVTKILANRFSSSNMDLSRGSRYMNQLL